MAASALLLGLLTVPPLGCRGKPPVASGGGATDDETAATTDGQTADPESGTPTATDIGEAGPALYARHCAACHGEHGDGQGIAAAYLYPKPRDFRAGKFRLVSTVNRIPSADDLRNVLNRGMPGSAMLPWDHLSDEEIQLLVAEVQRLHQQGVHDEYVRILKEDEELSDEEIAEPDVQEEIADYVQGRTTAGETTEVPKIAVADAAAIARGKKLWLIPGTGLMVLSAFG